MRARKPEQTRDQVLAAMGEGKDTLHELDYEDVALTGAALSLVRRAARSILRRISPQAAEDLPTARALALFLDRVFWEEKSGGLILCAEFPGQSFCLPIPRDFWGMKPRTGPLQ